MAFGELISVSKQLGNIEFHPSQTAQVFSHVNGVIETIVENSPLATKGYEIFIKTKSDSCFTIIIDHVRNLAVTEGQAVSIGTLLGNPGKFGASLGQVELQINDDKEKKAWCAMAFMDSATRATYNAKIDDFRSDWENLISDSSVYDESKDSNGSGLCHFESLLESEIVNE